MSLANDIKLERARLEKPSCKVCAWLETLELEDQTQVNNWVKDGLAVTSLWRLCTNYGLDCRETTFRRHARQCDKEGQE